MASCEHLQRTSMYFDGELAPGEEREAADHIATCAECQALLGDAAGLDAVLSTAKPAVVSVAPVAPRRRWQIALGAATLVAAAAIAIVVLRPKPPDKKPDEHVALVLPPKRAVEARFSGDELGKHRPYEAAGASAHEAIDVRALAELERTGKTRDLVGALASSGELVRAEELARKTPNDAGSLSDLAAIALANGDAEAALDLAYRALDVQDLPAARWNLALAARRLKLWRVSRAAFQAVAARAEPGWATEAKQNAALIDREITRSTDIERMRAQFARLVRDGSVAKVVLDDDLKSDLGEFRRVMESIAADETPVELVYVRSYPSHAWQFMADSLVNAPRDVVVGLEPVAKQLDAIAQSTAPSDMLRQTGSKRSDPFAKLAGFTGDVLPDACTNDVFAVPCVPIAWQVARVQLTAGKLQEAQRTAETGRDHALREYLPVDYALLAEIHTKTNRAALARADREEAALASR